MTLNIGKGDIQKIIFCELANSGRKGISTGLMEVFYDGSVLDFSSGQVTSAVSRLREIIGAEEIITDHNSEGNIYRLRRTNRRWVERYARRVFISLDDYNMFSSEYKPLYAGQNQSHPDYLHSWNMEYFSQTGSLRGSVQLPQDYEHFLYDSIKDGDNVVFRPWVGYVRGFATIFLDTIVTSYDQECQLLSDGNYLSTRKANFSNKDLLVILSENMQGGFRLRYEGFSALPTLKYPRQDKSILKRANPLLINVHLSSGDLPVIEAELKLPLGYLHFIRSLEEKVKKEKDAIDQGNESLANLSVEYPEFESKYLRFDIPSHFQMNGLEIEGFGGMINLIHQGVTLSSIKKFFRRSKSDILPSHFYKSYCFSYSNPLRDDEAIDFIRRNGLPDRAFMEYDTYGPAILHMDYVME